MTEQNTDQDPDLKALLIFVVDILRQVKQYTSKHCTDCVQNRFRAEAALSYLDNKYSACIKKSFPPEVREHMNIFTLGHSSIAEEIEKESWDIFNEWQAHKKMF